MKRTILAFGLLMAWVSVSSQSANEELAFYQSIFGMEKKALVSSFVDLDEQSAETFWGLYDEYEAARKVLGQKRFEILNKYANAYLNLDDATTDALIAESQQVNKDQAKLITRYYKKLKKAGGSKAAAQFYQLENYFQSAIRITLMEQVPFIGEFDL